MKCSRPVKCITPITEGASHHFKLMVCHMRFHERFQHSCFNTVFLFHAAVVVSLSVWLITGIRSSVLTIGRLLVNLVSPASFSRLPWRKRGHLFSGGVYERSSVNYPALPTNEQTATKTNGERHSARLARKV